MRSKILFTLFVFLLCVSVVPAYADFTGLHGFGDFAYGVKVSDDTTKRDNFNMLEQRLQLKTQYFFEGDNYLADKAALVNFKGDFVVDEYYNAWTDFELREMNIAFTPFDIVDIKAGRQIITWGTGTYLYINDMFPKDYVAFLIGRDDEYLKKPSDAIKASFYPKFANIDFVLIPSFTPNTDPVGDRVSFYDVYAGGINGESADTFRMEPPVQMSNNEYALRIYKNINGNELALYYFHGFDKTPNSFKDQLNHQVYYERMDVYGWSVRGAVAGGIGSVEFGYLNSREDPDGTDRLIENSSIKGLAGYTRDLGNDLKVGFQYYYEQTLDYAALLANKAPSDVYWDEYEHIITGSIEKLFKGQTVSMSLFTFYSPSNKDGYVRPSVSYDITDNAKVTLGANLFWGEEDKTTYGQFQQNNNVYVRVRYSF